MARMEAEVVKRFLKLSIAGIFIFALDVCGQTNFTKQVSSLWFSGQKSNVLSIATQRLQVNSNDIAGLILKMEYEIEFLDLIQVTNTMERVSQVGSTITTPKFMAVFPRLQGEINHLRKMIPLYPPDELSADRKKGDIAGKPLPYTEALQALQDDGYFH